MMKQFLVLKSNRSVCGSHTIYSKILLLYLLVKAKTNLASGHWSQYTENWFNNVISLQKCSFSIYICITSINLWRLNCIHVYNRQRPETDQSEIPNAEQILSALKKKRLNQFSYSTSGVSRWGSLEPSFESKLFYFHWDI